MLQWRSDDAPCVIAGLTGCPLALRVRVVRRRTLSPPPLPSEGAPLMARQSGILGRMRLNDLATLMQAEGRHPGEWRAPARRRGARPY